MVMCLKIIHIIESGAVMFDISIASQELVSETNTETFNLQSLTQDLGTPNAHSIFSYNASAHNLEKASEILSVKSGENIFYSSINEIRISQVTDTTLTEDALSSIKEVRDNFRDNYERIAAPIDPELDSDQAWAAMLQKQMDVSIASLEIELTSKIAGTSIQNMMLLLRQ